MDEVAELSRRAEAGDPDALFALAARMLAGDGVAADLPRARELFKRSAEAGRFDAGVIYVNLVANGTGGAPDWPRGLALLDMLAQHDPHCRRELELIGAMALTGAGDPVSVPQREMLSEAPHVVLIPGLLTAAECRFLADTAAPMLQPAVVEDQAGQKARHPGRTSDSVGLSWPLESPAVHALNRRIAAASGTRADQGEPLQILRYRPGQEYKPHFDAIPGFGNQRTLTFLVWLNDDYAGGETHFLATGLKAKGRAGDALLFRNAGADGRRDENAAHAGLPVTGGEKWLASRWIRAARYDGS